MQQIKNSHRPDAPGTWCCHTLRTGSREETTGTGWPGLVAVGGKKASAPKSGQWRSHTTKTTTRGTHDTRRTIYTRPSPKGRPGSGRTCNGCAHGRAAFGNAAEMACSSSISAIHTDTSSGETGHGADIDCPVERGDRPATTALASQRWLRLPLRIATSRYSFSSCLRTGGGVWRQFWPVFMPVQRAHFLACDLTSGKTLDGFAVFSCNGLLSGGPIGYHGLGNAQQLSDGQASAALLFNPFLKCHVCIISHGVSICQ